MKKFFGRQSLTKICMAVATACAFSCSASAQEEIAFDDFENLTLEPFTLDYSSPYFLDGTDYTKDFPQGWTLDNSGNLYDNTGMPPEFDGWSLMDTASWIGHAGNQAGRIRCSFGGDERNIALVADPDEADDGGNANMGSPANPLYNSYISREYDITAADNASLEISFDYDFVTEDTQTGVVEISFDGGGTWINLLTIDSTVDSGVFTTSGGDKASFVAGTDFTADLEATSLILRFGMIRSSNDWWFCIDNIGVSDTNGVIAFEDFEDQAIEDGMVAFAAANGGPTEPDPGPSDGSDWTRDIANWTVDNDGFWDPELRMYTRSAEGAFDGWAAVDAQSWNREQGGQLRETFFPNPSIFMNQPNTVLVADPDAHDDTDTELEADDPNKSKKEFNSFVYREYDVADYDNTTIAVELDWETRVESQQRALIQVSFDKGATWVDLLDADSDDPDKLQLLLPFLAQDGGTAGVVDTNDLLHTLEGPELYQLGTEALPAKNGSSMILRFGCIDAQNNWWFAVDNIRITGVAQDFKHGDANQDGMIDFGDLGAFIQALQDKAAYDGTYAIPADTILDMDANGVFNFGDIAGFLNEF